MNFLFLHGLAGDSSDWKETSLLLESKGHNCLSISIPYLTSNFNSLDNLAEQLYIPKEFLGKNSIIVGNSLGGSLALKLGRYTKNIVLVASYTTTSTEHIGRGMVTLNKEISRIFFKPELLSHKKKNKYKNLWLDITSSKKEFSKLVKIKRIINQDNVNCLYKIFQNKIYAICGENDKLSPLENFYNLQKDFPKIKLKIVNECGHAIPLEKPKELSIILLNNILGE